MSGSVSYCEWASGVDIIRKTEIADPAPSECIAVDISDLHDRCGIYTDHETAKIVLKKIGWTKFNSLRKARLLEPCAGDGALLIVAIRELIGSFRKHEIPLHFQILSRRIIAFEIHPREAQKARKAAAFELTTLGLSASLASRLANKWIRTEDFLLTPIGRSGITHVVANPPYIRWRHIPSALAKAYRSALPTETTRSDLCVAFIARIIDTVSPSTRIGILSSDRWLYAVYADSFRRKWLPKVKITELLPVDPSSAFRRPVSTCPLICVMRRENGSALADASSVNGVESNGELRSDASSLSKMRNFQNSKHSETVAEWQRSFPSIEAAACRIKVGPALGHEPAFVGMKNELQVEEKLLSPYLSPREIIGESIHWSGRWVLCVGSPSGGLIDLSAYPHAKVRLDKFKEMLEKRSCVRNEESWFKTIDRTVPADWAGEKILVPELARLPRAAYDDEGIMPSHGIYAIFSDEWPTEVLWNVLSSGILRITLEAIAPRVSGGWIRCYKRFLSQVPLPSWNSLSVLDRNALTAFSKQKNRSGIIKSVAAIYGVEFKILERYSSHTAS